MLDERKADRSVAEATEAINEILAGYGETVRITFRKTDAEIIDSCLVDSADVRRAVCGIIVKTGLTGRSCGDLAAEWRLHNVSFRVGFFPRASKDVSLDYAGDPRLVVRLATKLFHLLHLE